MAASRPLLEDEPSSGSPLHIGQIVNGKYRIERQIGRGGMGVVLAATHLQLEHLVAIKVMRRDLVEDDRALDRLLMEARSAARIRSEHVARVLDVGTLENGSPFIVMEYLEGENLADLLDREGALEVEQAASFLLQCCLALAEVHVAEMVHRDLKPGNLFIARLPDGAPMVKIVDFGISKQIGSARDSAATTSPQVLGSPFYMSPEQMRAEAVDERSDIWGLGAILFEMLTGRPPFIGDTLPEVYSAVLNEAPPGVDTLRSGVPGGLDDVVQRCLEKDPAQRFCDVADLAEALAPYAGSAAQLVERVTRILTNPEAVRARYSLPPIADGTGAHAPLEGSALGADVHGFGMRGAHDSGEAIMANGENGADGGRKRPNADISPGGTLLESDSDDGAAAGQRRSWRPSRPPLSGEFAPFSATGVHAGGPARRARSRLPWLVAALALVAGAGSFWMLDASRRRPAPPVAPVVQVLPVPPPQPVPVEPRVTPIVESPRSVASSSQPQPEPADAVQSRAQALQPMPRAKPAPSSPVPAPDGPRSVASSASQAVYPSEPSFQEPAVSGEATAPVQRPAVPARALPGRSDDPWDPDSFGDRR
jgi:eukaryotic-like serine/threonine-protein kinase